VSFALLAPLSNVDVSIGKLDSRLIKHCFGGERSESCLGKRKIRE
jgi:hypothetical protein